jgi:suppressor of ftsI
MRDRSPVRSKKRSTHTYLVLLAVAIICSSACTKRNGTGQSFVDPLMLTSHDGKLHVDLVAAPATYTIGGHRFEGMLYNGQYVPPVWRLRAGDTLTVALHNQLSEETNLHFHGLNVSPLNHGDNVFLHIAPNETFTYQIKVPERRIGLFWFHPHMHGDVDRQIIGGMSGGILVEGSDRLYPFLKGLIERVLFLKHHPIGRADYQELVTVNGTVAPTIAIRPGEAQFWQIGNIGADRFLQLKIDEMPFYLIGRDGYFVPSPIRMEEVILGPGQRVSAIIVGGQAGRHAFKSVAFKFDEHQPPIPEVSLGTVESNGPAADVAAAEGRVGTQHVNGPLYVDMLRSSPIARSRTSHFR